MKPWLSVVMPTYNGAAHLPSALASVAAQADDGVEVIAVDDGSCDATLDILASFSNRLQLEIIRRPHVGNWVANTNVGLRGARGTWACILHQDDLWMPGRIDRLRSARGAGASMILHAARYLDDSGSVIGTWRCPLPANRLLEAEDVVAHLLVQNFIAMPSPTFLRTIALDLGGLDESLWYTADWDLWLKLAGAGRTVYFREALAGFRVHAQSQTVKRGSVEVREQLARVIERYLPAWEAAHPQQRVVPQTVRFSMALNVALSGALHGQPLRWAHLVASFLSLGPSGWRRYFDDSRMHERLAARLIALYLR
jgi:glycosyltransferase involved in cell wall biosynthesis